jgi:hypothetical protein
MEFELEVAETNLFPISLLLKICGNTFNLIAMSKKCMPKIVKRFDYTQDLLERR